jgi:hypothetical protein
LPVIGSLLLANAIVKEFYYYETKTATEPKTRKAYDDDDDDVSLSIINRSILFYLYEEGGRNNIFYIVYKELRVSKGLSVILGIKRS